MKLFKRVVQLVYTEKKVTLLYPLKTFLVFFSLPQLFSRLVELTVNYQHFQINSVEPNCRINLRMLFQILITKVRMSHSRIPAVAPTV